MSDICPNCGLKPIVVFHTMIDGNYADFCSMSCIEEYSRHNPKVRIVLIEIYRRKYRRKKEWRIA